MSNWPFCRRAIFWVPIIAWGVFIFFLSSVPRLRAPGPDFAYKDKLGHWALYCILSGLVAHGLRRGHGLSLPKTVVLATLLSSAYGAVDELYQRHVPYRTCDPIDWVADTLGAAAAAAAYYAYDSARSTKKNR